MRDLVALWTSMPQDLRDLIITLLGTLAGVLVAFWLDRLWERRQSKQRYRQHLDACRYDLGNAAVICKQIETLVTGAGTNILSIKAPALEALLLNPVLHEHAPHGLIMALTTISTIINTNQTMMEHCRHMGRQLVKQEVEDIQNRMTQLVRVIEYVLTLIDAELNRFCPSDVRTKEDKEMVEGLTKILRGDS